MSRPLLTTSRVRLEPMTSEHLPLLVELDADPEVMRYLLGRARTAQEVHDFWGPICADTEADAVGLGWWVGWSRSDGAFLGWWDLSSDRPVPSRPSRAEAGWRLHRRHWGRGYATEGAIALLDHGFATVGLSRVWAETMTVNRPSRRVMARLGMRHVSTEQRSWAEPLPGAERGDVVYEVSREEWAAARVRGMTTPATGGGRPQVRSVVRDLPAYVPGRPPAPREGLPTYKLSSNENPYEPLPAVLEAAVEAAGRMNRYPDMGCTELYAALGAKLDVPVARLAAGTGSVAVLYHLLQALCESGDEVVYAWRSFEAYPIAVAVTGARSVQVPLTADARHDLDAMADAVTDRTKVVIVCSPNNPTGPAVGADELATFLDRVPPHVVVVLDEAYREFVRTPDGPVDGVALQRQRPNLVAMRTFAKAYGLAGFRVGYVVAEEQLAAAVRACALPFGVSSVAQAATVAALAHEDELLERVQRIVAERARVVAALTDQGWHVPDAQGNFVWLAAGERSAELAAAADRAGVMVRPFAGEGVRVSIGEPAGNDVLLAVTAGFRR